MKKCCGCELVKSKVEFRKKSKNKDGLNSQCRECEAIYNRERYKRDKTKINARNKAYRDSHSISETRKAYIEANKEHIKNRNKEYYKVNADKIKAQALLYKTTIEGKLSLKASNGKRRALKNSNSDNTITKHSLEILLTVQNNKCYHCGEILDSSMHLDHYIPFKAKGLHSIFNVVWSCAFCNLSKSGKYPKTPLRNEHISLLKESLN